MTDYIKREDALKAVDDIVCDADDAERTCDRIIDLPSADVVEVVRCKDCFLFGECKAAEWYGENGNGYCSIGDRRKDDE